MNDAQSESLTFEQALAELERIVHDLEDSQTGLEDALDRYERGVRLIKQCHGLLQQAEQRILLLTAVDELGQAILKPFEHAATVEQTTTSVRRVRKKQIDTAQRDLLDGGLTD